MPVAADLAGTWTWNHRRDVSAWADDPVVNATGDALMTTAVAVAQEGWLTLHPAPGGGTVMSALDEVLNWCRWPPRRPWRPGSPTSLLLPATVPADRAGTARWCTRTPARQATTRCRRRVVAMLGPGATFRGIAEPRCYRSTPRATGGPSRSPSTSWPTGWSSTTGTYLPAGTWDNHKVGLCLPLPIEIDPATGAWTVNADDVRGWAGSFVRRLAPTALHPHRRCSPCSSRPRSRARPRRPRVPRTPAPAPAALWERVLRNPSEAVLTRSPCRSSPQLAGRPARCRR